MNQIKDGENILKDLLRALQKKGQLRSLDYSFALFIFDLLKSRASSDEALLVSCLAALVSYQLGAGHSCLVLDRLADTAFWPDLPKLAVFDSDFAKIETILKNSAVVTRDGISTVAPLCLEENRLYLYRYWHYENKLATYLTALMGRVKHQINISALRPLFGVLFPKDDTNPWPAMAAALALKQHFLLVSGGPGTGKTSTVTRILALLTAQAKQEGKKILIQLAAPTGKAAARLNESIAAAKVNLAIPSDILANIPEQALTLHRLLGSVPMTQGFRFNRENPLHVDVLLIDEASMIDLPMMCAVLEALPAQAQLILLGDKDQLSSVEPGSVLAELCANDSNRLSPGVSVFVEQFAGFTPGADSALSEHALVNSLCQLKRSYRFSESSGIARLARSVNAGETLDFDAYASVDKAQEDIVFFPLEQQERCLALVLERYASFIKACQQAETPAARLLQQRSTFQVLCATREGRWGVNEINTWVENALRKSGLINNSGYYPGCAIMINQNSYTQQLFNGDIGLVLADPDNRNELSVFFPPQLSGIDQAPRQFHLSRLPTHEKVYAMTVHKSQGSEFDELVLIYPDQDSPVLTRELLYTAVTRAKKRCYLLADPSLLNASVKRKTRRDSGLAVMLKKL